MSGNISKEEAQKLVSQVQTQEEDDEPDEWDKRIFSTGCADENMKMTDCYFETKDWRKCKDEMETFRQCWKSHGNDERVSTKDSDKTAKS